MKGGERYSEKGEESTGTREQQQQAQSQVQTSPATGPALSGQDRTATAGTPTLQETDHVAHFIAFRNRWRPIFTSYL